MICARILVLLGFLMASGPLFAQESIQILDMKPIAKKKALPRTANERKPASGTAPSDESAAYISDVKHERQKDNIILGR